MSKESHFILPLRAVSQNTFWGHTKGGMKYITEKGRNWRDSVQLLTRSALRKGEIRWHGRERLKVSYIFYLKTKRTIDTFNMEKPLTDSLQGLLFEDDEQINCGVVTRIYGWEKDMIEILIVDLGLPITESKKSANRGIRVNKSKRVGKK